MEFRILGSFEVIGSTGLVDLRGAKRRGLLACLVVHARQPLSTDRLVEELWGDDGSNGAARTVQTYVSQLRKLLHGESASLQTRPGGYVLEVDPGDIDAYRFEQGLVAAGAEGDPRRRLEMLDATLELWRGAPLGEFAGVGWADREATRLEALHLQALQGRYDALIDLDRAREVVAELELLVSAHPLDETLWAQLLIALYRSGRQADALGAYQQARRHLVDELGIEPGPQLAELEHRILGHDPTLTAASGSPVVVEDKRVRVSAATGDVSPPTGTITFLFTDQEQSSSLWEANPKAMDQAVSRHDAMVRSIISRWGGRVFSTAGDGFGAAFASHADAIRAAVEAQTALRAEPWPDGVELRVRMGLHTGATFERGGNYFGPPVNRAARVMGAAHGGQVLVSQVTRELVDEQRLGLRFIDLGRHRLRGLDAPEHLHQLVIEGDDTTYSPPATLGVAGYELPAPRSSLHGREDDIAALVALLETTRVVTLVGVGGVGKTRLAVEVAWRIADSFESAALIDLAAVSDSDDVVGAAATVLRIPVGDKRATVAGIIRSLRARDVLVVFDNCEHVLGAVSELIDEVAAAATGCRLLVTSREPLGVEGEQRWPVRPLRGSDAAELFVSRARALRPDYALEPADRQKLDELCRRLDGLPLALELAAAQLGYLSVAELLERLGQRFQVLASGRRRTDRRSRTLEATMEWSYQLLDPEEQRLLRACSVFPGGFTLESLAGVAMAPAATVEKIVGSLVAKSLVTIDDWQVQPTRYRLLETVREFAHHRLVDAHEADKEHDQFASWFCDRLAAYVARVDEDPRSGRTFCATELDNLLAALDWVAEQGDLVRVGRAVSLMAMAINEYRWVDMAGRFVRRVDIEQVLDGDELALYLLAGAWNENALGHLGEQLALAERAMAAASSGGRVLGYAAILRINALSVFDPDRGVELADELLVHADSWPVRVLQGLLAGKADCKIMSGDYSGALAIYAEACGPRLPNWPISAGPLLEVVGRHDDAKELVRAEVATDEFYLYYLQLGRALVTAGDGEHDQALSQLRSAAHLARVRAASLLDRDLLVVAAALALLRGDACHASRLLAVERDSLWTRTPSTWALYVHVRDQVRHLLSHEEIAQCKAEAASLTVDTALAAELGEDWPLER
jgi:predicted ATPase/DNA-binding SARP family transcriptional activator